MRKARAKRLSSAISKPRGEVEQVCKSRGKSYGDPQAMLMWSDDGGSTWSNQHWASIGKVGKYKNRAMWRRLGTARDRIFQVEVTDPVFRTVVSANLNATPGAN